MLNNIPDSGGWWETGKPGILQPMGSWRVGHNLATEQQCSILCIYHTYLSIHLSVNVSTFWLLWIMMPWTWVSKYLFESLLFFLLGIYPEMKLLNDTVTLCSVVWGPAILFSSDCSVLHSHQQWTRVLISPYPCQHWLFSVSVLICKLVVCISFLDK